MGFEPKVLIVLGSDSDLPVMAATCSTLEEFGVDYSLRILSAHRVPQEVAALASSAKEQHYQVIIAAAGMAAHLPGVIAAYTVVPVIGVPMKTSSLGGLDSLYSIVQMPRGIPVATVAINGAANAGLLAVQILALRDEKLHQKLLAYRRKMAGEVTAKDQHLKEVGAQRYLQEKGGL